MDDEPTLKLSPHNRGKTGKRSDSIGWPQAARQDSAASPNTREGQLDGPTAPLPSSGGNRRKRSSKRLRIFVFVALFLILLLGSDNDNKYNFPALLTQVMMVVHIDTVNNSAYLVSIPRDSWVYVPEVGGMHKIDQAFFLGATQQNSFDDGVRLARLTVEKDYGITIDRYAWVGLSGFASVIDTLGGIDIDVTHPILDDAYPDDTQANPNDPYAVKRLYLAPGPQHLNGLQALEYVRSRHADLVGDIGRTNRQQQVLAALKKKLTLTNVITHLKDIIANLQGKVYTDLSEQEMLAFANYGRSLPDSAIHRITLGPGSGNQDFGDFSNVYDPSAGSNQDVIIPNCQNIQPVINTIFGLGDVHSCNVTGS